MGHPVRAMVQFGVAQALLMENHGGRIRSRSCLGFKQPMQGGIAGRRTGAGVPLLQQRAIALGGQREVIHRQRGILQRLLQHVGEALRQAFDFLGIQIRFVIDVVGPCLVFQVARTQVKSQRHLLVAVGDLDRVAQPLRKLVQMVVLFVGQGHIEQLPAFVAQVQATQGETLVPVILLEPVAHGTDHLAKSQLATEAEAHRADLGKHANGAFELARAVEQGQAHHPFIALRHAGEIDIHGSQQHMVGRGLEVFGQLSHALM